MAQRRERTVVVPLQPEELLEQLSAATRHAASLKREIAAVPQREAPPPARAPGQGAADIVRLRHQIAQLRGKVDVAERALRSELEDGQTSLAAAVENQVDGYFAESARLRRELHEPPFLYLGCAQNELHRAAMSSLVKAEPLGRLVVQHG